MTGVPPAAATAEVDAVDRAALHLRRLGRQVRRRACTHRRSRDVTLAMNEPIGVDRHRLPGRGAAARLRLAGRAGDRHGQPRGRGAVASATRCSATDLYQVLETSDVPAGVINIVTGERDELAESLAEHDDVDALWYFGARTAAADGRSAPRPAT